MSYDISELLVREEAADLEFKSRLPDNESLAALLSAFANTAGGDLIVGVSDRKPRKVTGLHDADVIALEQRISSVATTSIAPRITPFTRIVNVDGKYALSVHVEQGYQRPYEVVTGRSAGKVFVRVGSTTSRRIPLRYSVSAYSPPERRGTHCPVLTSRLRSSMGRSSTSFCDSGRNGEGFRSRPAHVNDG